jgi:hypothetical protein
MRPYQLVVLTEANPAGHHHGLIEHPDVTQERRIGENEKYVIHRFRAAKKPHLLFSRDDESFFVPV